MKYKCTLIVLIQDVLLILQKVRVKFLAKNEKTLNKHVFRNAYFPRYRALKFKLYN